MPRAKPSRRREHQLMPGSSSWPSSRTGRPPASPTCARGGRLPIPRATRDSRRSRIDNGGWKLSVKGVSERIRSAVSCSAAPRGGWQTAGRRTQGSSPPTPPDRSAEFIS